MALACIWSDSDRFWPAEGVISGVILCDSAPLAVFGGTRLCNVVCQRGIDWQGTPAGPSCREKVFLKPVQSRTKTHLCRKNHPPVRATPLTVSPRCGKLAAIEVSKLQVPTPTAQHLASDIVIPASNHTGA